MVEGLGRPSVVGLDAAGKGRAGSRRVGDEVIRRVRADRSHELQYIGQ